MLANGELHKLKMEVVQVGNKVQGVVDMSLTLLTLLAKEVYNLHIPVEDILLLLFVGTLDAVDKCSIYCLSNELNAAGNIPGKSDVLPKLLKYRKIRNKLAHEEGALSEDNSLEKADLKWLRGFKKSVEKHRDPISKSKKGGISGKAITWIIAAALVVVAAVLTVIFIL